MKSAGHSFRVFCRTLVLACGLLGILGVLLSAWSPIEFESEAGEEDEKPAAEAWFYEQRAYPLTEIPRGAHARAVEDLNRKEEARRQQLRRLYGQEGAEAIEQSQPRWQALGPQPIINGNTGIFQSPVSGRATALALDPGYDGVNNRTLYLGTAHGGVWRSRDNGANWTPISDGEASLAIGSLAIDPNNPNVIYVGTGEGNASGDSYYGAGLLKTTDGGASWRLIKGPPSNTAPIVPAFQGVAIMHIAIDPANSQTLYLCTRGASAYGPAGGGGTAGYAAGQRGVWKSTDGGETWRFLDVAGSNVVSANEVIFDPQNSNTIYAAIAARGIYRSRNGGEPGSWELLGGGLPTANISRIDLEIGPPLAPATVATFYAAFTDSSGGINGIYRSTDNAATWTRTANNPSPVSQGTYNWTLSVDPLNANILYFGAVTFFRSTDGGTTWTNQANGVGIGGLHVDQHASVVSRAKPNTFFIANDGGVWRCDNANVGAQAMDWVNLNNTLNTVQFQGVALHPSDENFLLGGTQDNGTNRYSGALGWTRVAGGDGGFALVDQAKPNIVWHSFQNSSGTNPDYGPRVSLNGGGSWTDRGCRSGCTGAAGQMKPTDRVGFYSPMNLHTGFTEPNNVIYWGTHRLYRSPDLGITWTGIGPSTDGGGQDVTKGAGRVTAITAHPQLDNSTNPPGEIVWVGTSDGNIQITKNAGRLAEASFTNLTKTPLPNRFVTDIALDPKDVNRAFVTFSGFNVGTPGTPGHVFVTTDQGVTWRDISGDLPDVPVTSIALDPLAEGTLFIGTDMGVFQTTDNGTTWVRLGNGLPRVASFMVRYHAASRSIVVATHGRGMLRLKLPAANTTVSAASYTRAALAVEGIVAAFGNALATGTVVAPSLPLPTSLAGTTVKVTDALGVEHLAPLFFVSPTQVNYQIPERVAPGGASVTITSGDGTTSFGIEQIRAVGPALFTTNANGRGVPAAQVVRVRGGTLNYLPVARFDNASNQFVPAEIDLGAEGDQSVLVLYGSGVRRRTNLARVRVTIGGVDLSVDYAGSAPGFVGLDQINVPLPRSLAGRGEVDVVMTVDGVAANTIRIRIK